MVKHGLYLLTFDHLPNDILNGASSTLVIHWKDSEIFLPYKSASLKIFKSLTEHTIFQI